MLPNTRLLISKKCELQAAQDDDFVAFACMLSTTLSLKMNRQTSVPVIEPATMICPKASKCAGLDAFWMLELGSPHMRTARLYFCPQF